MGYTVEWRIVLEVNTADFDQAGFESDFEQLLEADGNNVSSVTATVSAGSTVVDVAIVSEDATTEEGSTAILDTINTFASDPANATSWLGYPVLNVTEPVAAYVVISAPPYPPFPPPPPSAVDPLPLPPSPPSPKPDEPPWIIIGPCIGGGVLLLCLLCCLLALVKRRRDKKKKATKGDVDAVYDPNAPKAEKTSKCSRLFCCKRKSKTKVSVAPTETPSQGDGYGEAPAPAPASDGYVAAGDGYVAAPSSAPAVATSYEKYDKSGAGLDQQQFREYLQDSAQRPAPALQAYPPASAPTGGYAPAEPAPAPPAAVYGAASAPLAPLAPLQPLQPLPQGLAPVSSLKPLQPGNPLQPLQPLQQPGAQAAALPLSVSRPPPALPPAQPQPSCAASYALPAAHTGLAPIANYGQFAIASDAGAGVAQTRVAARPD